MYSTAKLAHICIDSRLWALGWRKACGIVRTAEAKERKTRGGCTVSCDSTMVHEREESRKILAIRDVPQMSQSTHYKAHLLYRVSVEYHRRHIAVGNVFVFRSQLRAHRPPVCSTPPLSHISFLAIDSSLQWYSLEIENLSSLSAIVEPRV